GAAFSAKVLCTVRLSRRLYPELRGHNLDALIERLGLVVSGRHRALPDAQALWEFVQAVYRDHSVEEVQCQVDRLLQTPSPAAAASARHSGNHSGRTGRISLLWPQSPAAVHRQERRAARSGALAFLLRLSLRARPATVERNGAHRMGRNGG